MARDGVSWGAAPPRRAVAARWQGWLVRRAWGRDEGRASSRSRRERARSDSTARNLVREARGGAQRMAAKLWRHVVACDECNPCRGGAGTMVPVPLQASSWLALLPNLQDHLRWQIGAGPLRRREPVLAFT